MPGKAKSKSTGAARAARPTTRASRATQPRKTATKATATKRAAAKPRASAGKAAPRRPAPGGSGDWRDTALARMRALIREADAEMSEEQKWKKPSNAMKGVPVWSHHGIVCTGETYKDKVKLTFARGASLDDPEGLLNSGLDGGTRRAIDIREKEVVDAHAFKALIKTAVAKNASRMM